MKKILSLLVFSFSLFTSYAQHDIWIDINGVRDLTADSIDIARAAASQQRAETVLHKQDASDTEIKLAQARLHRALVRQNVASYK